MAEPFPSVPFLKADEIRAAAEDFLREYHPGGDIPVPIEEIVEFSLGMEVRPVRRLRHRFEVDGFLSADLSMIVVDEELMNNYLNRYVFTLAHEIGHRVLHAAQIGWVLAEQPEDWKRNVQEIPSQDYSRMEFQANEFAGVLLVPADPLSQAYRDAAEYAQERKIDLSQLDEQSLSHVANWIGKRFSVSGQVITRRLKREGLVVD